MKDAVIFDMDGTLANVTSIRHLLHAETNGKGYKDFHAFHRESVNVPAHPEVVSQAQVNHLLGNANIIVTARGQMWARHTAFWLAMHNIPSDAMFMRKQGDSRPDTEVKKDILDAIRCSWNVIHAVDDNPAVIALWQSEGIPVTVIPGWEW